MGRTGETVLVTGGAGYVGSHVLLALSASGIPAVAVDDLSAGRSDGVPNGTPLVVADCGDERVMTDLMAQHKVGAVMHFAAKVVVPESVARPLCYYRANVLKSHGLLSACVRAGVSRFIFSSTAAVYGSPTVLPLDEDAPTTPINPYGASKLMVEWMLRDLGRAHGMRSVVLRYFNVAGADPEGRSGQSTPEATHLIKVACQVALGLRPELSIFGEDFDTPDGTGVRDYIHVSDLAEAHVLALRHLANGGDSVTLNCGYGHGYSVREVVKAVEKISGQPLPTVVKTRRQGDPAVIVASAERARTLLGWQPRYDDLTTIIQAALFWERRLHGADLKMIA